MKVKNIVVIPARRNSRGFKFKNRILFENTLNFLKKINWFDEKIISTDDTELMKRAKKLLYKRAQQSHC